MTSNIPDLAPGTPRLAPGEPSAPPRSTMFDDGYFSSEDGLAESEAVFLAGCDLPEAWANRRRFVVGELGFGSGLNFLALARLWSKVKPDHAWLHFVSVEGFPLDVDQARAALAPFEALADFRAPLLAAWPPRIKGVHRRVFTQWRITLTVAMLDVSEALDQLDFAADAWFLDGFAPARNPDMWSETTLTALARRSNPGARAATFSVAGVVRRGLDAAGFAVEKRPGHGRKRERLEARLTRADAPPESDPLFPRVSDSDREGPVLVIGAGIAGAATALALAGRGREIVVLDAGEAPPTGASGLPAGLVSPRLDLDDRPEARFHRLAYAFALKAYEGSDAFDPLGVVRCGEAEAGDRLLKLLQAQALPRDMLQDLDPRVLGLDVGTRSLLLPQAGVLRARDWIARVLANFDVRGGAAVASLARSDDGWVARDASGQVLAEAPTCVVATGARLDSFAQLDGLPIERTRGQLSRARWSGPPLPHALSWGSFLAPLGGDRLVFGATFDRCDGATTVVATQENDERNLAAVEEFAPGLASRISASSESFAALRAAPPDRLPVIGAVPDVDAYARRFAGLAQGRLEAGPPAPVHRGLYVIGGLGSRGLTWAPLLGEALASEICGEPGALEAGAARALHPARFLARRLKKGKPTPAP